MILIIDFGSQTTHLIGRRLREMGAKITISSSQNARSDIKKLSPKGIILSGGPASVYEKNAPLVDSSLFEFNIPLLGICYGEQLIAHVLNGNVTPGFKKEFGPTTLTLTSSSIPLMQGLPARFGVWMNHGDEVVKPPAGFVGFGHTPTIPYAGIYDAKRKIYGIQFHPEVVHTQFGEHILKNFLAICGIQSVKQTVTRAYVKNIISDIKDSVGDQKAICALSGGVDSSVAAVLVHEAIGDNLICFYIDSGLMRKDETLLLEKVFQKHYKMKIHVIHAKDIFLQALTGVVNPEEKRKVIGKTFIEVFEKEAKKSGATLLVQGTIYPDVIESKGSEHAHNIKSHHNVGGLPEHMNLGLLEPLRQFYKDEVRAIGTILHLPREIVNRHPFPGPGLAIRIVGEVTEKKLHILREADAIVREEAKSLKKPLWQAFAIFTGIKTTGVRGDARAYGETIAVRLIEAKDAMSAQWAKPPYTLLEKISSRIVNELPQVNRVVYDITTKPPATMEWE